MDSLVAPERLHYHRYKAAGRGRLKDPPSLTRATSGKERGNMTEGERREGSGGTRKNVHDEFDEAAGRTERKDRPPNDKDREETGGSGGVKDNVRDDMDKTQR